MERECYERSSELLLQFPTASLLAQVGECLQRHHELSLTVCSSIRPATQQCALAQVDIAIADATQEPEAAAKAFEIAAAVLGSHRASTYTEVMHTGLELFVRTRGGLLLLGPMSMTEWGGYFRSALREKGVRNLFRSTPQGKQVRKHCETKAHVVQRRPEKVPDPFFPGCVCMDKEISR